MGCCCRSVSGRSRTRRLTTACSRRRPGRIMRAAAAEAEALGRHFDSERRPQDRTGRQAQCVCDVRVASNGQPTPRVRSELPQARAELALRSTSSEHSDQPRSGGYDSRANGLPLRRLQQRQLERPKRSTGHRAVESGHSAGHRHRRWSPLPSDALLDERSYARCGGWAAGGRSCFLYRRAS